MIRQTILDWLNSLVFVQLSRADSTDSNVLSLVETSCTHIPGDGTVFV